jgi:hypothetical protein
MGAGLCPEDSQDTPVVGHFYIVWENRWGVSVTGSGRGHNPPCSHCCLISMTSLIIQSMNMDLVDTMLVSWSWIWRPCCVWPWPVHTPEVLSPWSSFTGQRKLVIFFGGRSTELMLCLDSNQMTRLKAVLTKRKLMEVCFSGGWSDPLWWSESPLDLLVARAVLPKGAPEKLQFIM